MLSTQKDDKSKGESYLASLGQPLQSPQTIGRKEEKTDLYGFANQQSMKGFYQELEKTLKNIDWKGLNNGKLPDKIGKLLDQLPKLVLEEKWGDANALIRQLLLNEKQYSKFITIKGSTNKTYGSLGEVKISDLVQSGFGRIDEVKKLYETIVKRVVVDADNRDEKLLNMSDVLDLCKFAKFRCNAIHEQVRIIKNDQKLEGKAFDMAASSHTVKKDLKEVQDHYLSRIEHLLNLPSTIISNEERKNLKETRQSIHKAQHTVLLLSQPNKDADYKAYVRELDKLALQGNDFAKYDLLRYYAEGRPGIERNLKLAALIYKDLMDNGEIKIIAETTKYIDDKHAKIPGLLETIQNLYIPSKETNEKKEVEAISHNLTPYTLLDNLRKQLLTMQVLFTKLTAEKTMVQLVDEIKRTEDQLKNFKTDNKEQQAQIDSALESWQKTDKSLYEIYAKNKIFAHQFDNVLAIKKIVESSNLETDVLQKFKEIISTYEIQKSNLQAPAAFLKAAWEIIKNDKPNQHVQLYNLINDPNVVENRKLKQMLLTKNLLNEQQNALPQLGLFENYGNKTIECVATIKSILKDLNAGTKDEDINSAYEKINNILTDANKHIPQSDDTFGKLLQTFYSTWQTNKQLQPTRTTAQTFSPHDEL